MSMHLCFNSNIIAFVNAQCTVILEFFVACQIDKFWLFFQPLMTGQAGTKWLPS